MFLLPTLFPSLPKICCLSDTEGAHHELRLGTGDLLIHCGDVTAFGMEEELEDFLQWFLRQDFRHKVFIAGNHDLCLENMS